MSSRTGRPTLFEMGFVVESPLVQEFLLRRAVWAEGGGIESTRQVSALTNLNSKRLRFENRGAIVHHELRGFACGARGWAARYDRL